MFGFTYSVSSVFPTHEILAFNPLEWIIQIIPLHSAFPKHSRIFHKAFTFQNPTTVESESFCPKCRAASMPMTLQPPMTRGWREYFFSLHPIREDSLTHTSAESSLAERGGLKQNFGLR
jgi:hypothetical protein